MEKDYPSWDYAVYLYILSASVSIFPLVIVKGIWAFAQNTVIEAVFILGTILGTEIMRTISISVSGMDNLAPITTSLCLLLSLINPLAAYMGYYGNITGDSGLMNLYCGRIGIDSSTQAFSFLFIRQRVLCASLWELPFGSGSLADGKAGKRVVRQIKMQV